MLKVFISSVQTELAAERRAVKDFLTHDPLLRRLVGDVFLFEDLPASDRSPDNIYLAEVEQRDIYLALFGNEYGWKNANGKSPTEQEFDHATKTGRERLVFVKGDDDKARDPDMAQMNPTRTRHREGKYVGRNSQFIVHERVGLSRLSSSTRHIEPVQPDIYAPDMPHMPSASRRNSPPHEPKHTMPRNSMSMSKRTQYKDGE